MTRKDIYGNPIPSEFGINFERDMALMDAEMEHYYSQQISKHSREARELTTAKRKEQEPA